MINATLFIRLVRANNNAGRDVRIIDMANIEDDAINGHVSLVENNTLYKLNIGGSRFYVNDIVNFINKGSLKVVVDN